MIGRDIKRRGRAYPARYYTTKPKRVSLILKAGLTTLWLFMGLAAWGIVTTTQQVPWQALAGMVGGLLFFGTMTCCVLLGRNLARIIPTYEKPLPSAKTTGTFFSGAALARNCGHLDSVADECGANRLSDFGFNDPLVGETVVWHEPADGLATVSMLLKAIAEKPASVDNSSAVLLELGRLEHAFTLAKENGVRIALLLEIGSGTDLKDWEIRKAHF